MKDSIKESMLSNNTSISEETKSFNHIIRNVYIFNHHIDRVFDVYASPEKTNIALKNFVSIITLKGKNIANEGTIIKCKWKNSIEVISKTLMAINKPFEKKIFVQCEVLKPFKITYQWSYIFFWNSIESTTLCTTELRISKNDFILFSKDLTTKKDMTIISQLFDKYLKTHIDDLVQTESIIINKNIDEVWAIVTDYQKFRDIVPSIADKVVYEGKNDSINTNIHLYFTNKNREYHLKVKEYSIDEMKGTRTFILNYYAGFPKAPKQEIIFELIDMKNNMCFLSFKHLSKHFIKYKIISMLALEKKEILSILKSFLECI